MTVEQSTFNVVLGGVIALVAWLVQQQFKTQERVSIVETKLKEMEENEDDK